jgi:hypothetical protein
MAELCFLNTPSQMHFHALRTRSSSAALEVLLKIFLEALHREALQVPQLEVALQLLELD